MRKVARLWQYLFTFENGYRCCGRQHINKCLYFSFVGDWNILWRTDPLLGNGSVNTFPRNLTRNNMTSITRQRISKQAFSTTERLCFLRGPCRGVIKGQRRSFGLMRLCLWNRINPCGGRVKCLHRDPASRRRRRKWKPQNWGSKIWSRVPRDSDPRNTALARASSIYKWQPVLSSERAPHKNKTVTVKQ
jgi:hypothetical protein